MMEERLELPQGTLYLLILKSLALESMHGWAISERLQRRQAHGTAAILLHQEIQLLSSTATPLSVNVG